MKIIGNNQPNMPWQDKPEGCKEAIWRYSENPVIGRNHIPCANSIFNSAVVPFGNEYRGVFRVDNRSRRTFLHRGRSVDGINWDIDEEPITINTEHFSDATDKTAPMHGYDPRVCFIEDRYYITWCNNFHGPTIGLAYTFDFEEFYQLNNIFLPFNRNGVLFPKKINDNYAILSRPSDNGHTPFGDIFYSESPDLSFWGNHHHVMSPAFNWECMKMGAGPVPIETDEGWLLIYHGVIRSCNGMVYSFGVALLDKDEPWKVIKRCKSYLLSPQTIYECVGDVANVTFPCAAITDAKTGRIAIYYGCADTVTGLAFTTIDEIKDFMDREGVTV